MENQPFQLPDRLVEFTLTDNHLSLIKHLHWIFEDNSNWGVPTPSPKRPFGNWDVLQDMMNILDDEVPEEIIDDDGLMNEWIDQNEERFQLIFQELHYALAIVCNLQTFETGDYVSDDYGFPGSWSRVEEPE